MTILCEYCQDKLHDSRRESIDKNSVSVSRGNLRTVCDNHPAYTTRLPARKKIRFKKYLLHLIYEPKAVYLYYFFSFDELNINTIK